MAATVTPLRKSRDLDVRRASEVAARSKDEKAQALLSTIEACKETQRQEMDRFASDCDRYDNLYYPNEMGRFGADHRPDTIRPGRNHISLNSYPVYVDVPSSLEAVPPVENMMPSDPDAQGARDLAALVERVYFAWKDDERFEIKSHKVAVTKRLYGRSAAKVYWDPDEGKPCVEIIDQPRNLWLGWSSTAYDRFDWAIYVHRMTPMAVMAEFGVDVTEEMATDGTRYPVVRPMDAATSGFARSQRDWLANQDFGMIEVHDFWYLKPKAGAKRQFGKRLKMETWNAILVGNVVVKDALHSEYDGRLPYVTVFNTYIPGTPNGRAAFFDIEQIMSEKEQRLEAGGQLIEKSIAGQLWQLTGQDAPDRVPVGLKPKPDTVVAPGAGNRIEKIEPFMPSFQWEQYLDRLDRELADISGLNDLLRGLAPAAVLSSSKAINALVANYEARLSMGRDMFYDWRLQVWELVKQVWGAKDRTLREVFKVAGRLSVKNPSLTPRDDLEVAAMVGNLVQQKIYSQVRAMDMTGVDDPEAEQQLIREESTDASLFPERVQTIAALLATFQQLGINPAQLSGQMSGQSPQGMGDAAAASRMAANGGMAASPMMNGTGEQPVTPEQPGNAQDAAMAGLLGGNVQTGPGFNAVSQTQVKNGEASNRLLLQQPIGPQGGA